MRKHYLRFRPMIVLIAVLAAGVFTLRAPQNTGLAGEPSDGVAIAGSGYMRTLFDSLLENYKAANTSDLAFNYNTGGNGPGFDSLCNNETDATLSTAYITDTQVLRCNENGVGFVELLMAIDHAVLVADADAEFTCVNQATVVDIFRTTSELTVSDLITGSEISDPVTVYGPESTNSAYTYLQAALEIEPALDEIFTDASAIVEPLSEAGNTGIAVMSFSQWQAIESDGLQLLSVRPAAGGDCVLPTPVSLTTGEYPAARNLLLYANATSIVDTELGPFLRYTFAVGEDDTRPVTDVANTIGFAAPDAAFIDRNINNVEGPLTGRTFSRVDNPTIINTALRDSIEVQGASISSFATNTVYTSFVETYTTPGSSSTATISATVDIKAFGDDIAWAAFCANEVSVIQVTRPATDEELANCQATSLDFFLGADAVVLVTAADSPLPMCLNYDQLAAMLGQPVSTSATTVETTDAETPAATAEVTTEATTEATEAAPDATIEATIEATEAPSDESADTVTEPLEQDNMPAAPALWSEIAPEWATDHEDLPLLVLVPAIGDLNTDIILGTVGVVPNFRRTDSPTIQTTPTASGLSDLDYRLAGVALTPGAITYVRWSEYQASTQRDNLRLVEIGENCTTPSAESIFDGSYPFSMSARLVFAQEDLGEPMVANLLWHFINRDVLASLEELTLIGFDRAAIEAQRDTIFNLLEVAATAAASEDETVAPSATEAAPESTIVPDDAPTVVPTETATETVTEAVTETATEAPTEAPTSVPTSIPTEEASEAATEAPTQEATAVPTEASSE